MIRSAGPVLFGFTEYYLFVFKNNHYFNLSKQSKFNLANFL
jgi:hypothetical protein